MCLFLITSKKKVRINCGLDDQGRICDENILLKRDHHFVLKSPPQKFSSSFP